MTNTASEVEKQPWWLLAPDLGKPEHQNAASLAVYWAASALAHYLAYDAAINAYLDAADGEGPSIHIANHAHLMPFQAGFSAAALAKGWTAEAVLEAMDSGDIAPEVLWRWVKDAGINPDAIESASQIPTRIANRIAERRAEAAKAGDPR